MSDSLPKKRIRRGIDKDREDERESLLERAVPPPSAPSATAVRKNPSRAVPDQTGFHGLTSSEIGDDFTTLEHDSSMITATTLPKQEGGRERDREKERYSCGVAKRALRPPCAPESTLYKKIQRYFHWVNDPSLIDADLSAYKAIVGKLHGELLELEMEAIRWHSNVNTVRTEFSNMESSLGAQVLEQEALETELCALLLREVAALEENIQGVSHGTRGKASLTMEDVASRLPNVDSVLNGQREACLAYARHSMQASGSKVAAVTDPLTNDVLLCSYRPPAPHSPQGTEDVQAAVTTAMDEVITDVVTGQQSQTSISQAEAKVTPAAGLHVSTSASAWQEPPELPAIVAHMEDKKRKIAELRPCEVFSETLHQSSGRLQALALPDEVERNHNYFKTKRTQGAVPHPGERLRCEVEATAAANKYSSVPLSAFVGLLQHPYKAGALEDLGLCTSGPPLSSSTSSGTSASKNRGRGGKAAANGSTGGTSETTVAMHMDALRRTPCEVPLFLSPFSSLEGWYAGTYEALEFPFVAKHANSPTATTGTYNIENQEHFMHPQFIQAGERIMAMINTLSGATQRAQIELADLEKEESEWKSQVTASGLALMRAEEALGAVQEGSRGQSLSRVAAAEPGAGEVNGAGVGSAGAVLTSSSSSEREGLLGLLGMGVANGNGADLNGSAASKKLQDSKRIAAKKKAAARRRR